MTLSPAQDPELRRTFVGGSDAAAACGLSSYKSELSLYLEKRQEAEPQAIDPALAERGHYLEPAICHWYEQKTGFSVRRRNSLIRHRDYPWMAANIDRDVVGQPGILEAKSITMWRRDQFGEPGTDAVPTEHLMQGHHYLACMPAKKWLDYAVLDGSFNLRIYRIERDEDMIARLIARELQFWRCVQTGTPPAPSNYADAQKLFPEVTVPSIVASSEQLDLIREYVTGKRLVTQGVTRLEEIKTALAAGLNSAGQYVDVAGTPLVSWLPEERKDIDETLLRKLYPAAVEACTVSRTSRVMRIRKGARG